MLPPLSAQVSFGRREADARLALVRKGACAAHVRASTAVS